MSTSALPTLFNQPAGQHLVYVRGNIHLEDLAELLAAMANASGGMVVIGINPRTQKVEGVIDVEQALSLIHI